MFVRVHGGRAAATVTAHAAEQRVHVHKLEVERRQHLVRLVESLGAGDHRSAAAAAAAAALAAAATTAENKQDRIKHI